MTRCWNVENSFRLPPCFQKRALRTVTVFFSFVGVPGVDSRVAAWRKVCCGIASKQKGGISQPTFLCKHDRESKIRGRGRCEHEGYGSVFVSCTDSDTLWLF